MRLTKDLREFIELLNSQRVEYVLVGAYAMAYHTPPRYTDDIDILVRPSAENSARLENVIGLLVSRPSGCALLTSNTRIKSCSSASPRIASTFSHQSAAYLSKKRGRTGSLASSMA